MKAGDLVKIRDWCKGGNSLAIVLGKKFPTSRECQIMFCDSGEIIAGYESNLELVSEHKRK